MKRPIALFVFIASAAFVGCRDASRIKQIKSGIEAVQDHSADIQNQATPNGAGQNETPQ